MTCMDDAPRPGQYNTLELMGSYVIKVRDRDGKLIHYDSGCVMNLLIMTPVTAALKIPIS